MTLPSSGTLSLLTPNYLAHGILPQTVPTLLITPSMVPYVLPASSLNRVLYASPSSKATAPEGQSPSFTYAVSDGTASSSSGTVYLLPSDLVVFSSTFSRDGQAWSVRQSSAATSSSSSSSSTLRVARPAAYESSQRGSLNHYIYGNDESVNGSLTPSSSSSPSLDGDLWVFTSPRPYGVGQVFNAAYGGSLSFTISSFSGDFSDKSKHDTNGREHLLPLVTLRCPECRHGAGTTVVFPLSKSPYDGKGSLKVELPLTEKGGWLIDPKNTLVAKWLAPSACEFHEVLARLSSVEILGDYTSWYEAIGLDDVKVKAAAQGLSKPKDGGRNQIPICAQSSPDASVCECA